MILSYRQIATIQTSTRASDEQGGWSAAWSGVFPNVPCTLSALSARDRVSVRSDGRSDVTHRMRCNAFQHSPSRGLLNVAKVLRESERKVVQHDGRYFEIVGGYDSSGRQEICTLDLAEKDFGWFQRR